MFLQVSPRVTWSALLSNFEVLKGQSANVLCNGAVIAQETLRIYFSERNSYGFVKSECRVESALPLCMTDALEKQNTTA